MSSLISISGFILFFNNFIAHGVVCWVKVDNNAFSLNLLKQLRQSIAKSSFTRATRSNN